MEKTLLGHCRWCDEPVYADQKHHVLPDDGVLHDECTDDYFWEHQGE